MGKEVRLEDLTKINEFIYEISKNYRSDMRVPARVFADQAMLQAITEDRSLDQLVNVTTLPGIQNHALAMPDIHQGYGFPIGGVAALSVEDGVISPGGIGYDINCGMRLLATNLQVADIKDQMATLADAIYNTVPSGVGFGGKFIFEGIALDEILIGGAKRMVELGYGNVQDLVTCEENGCFVGADQSKVSDQAKRRGADQIGTLGSGNHFLELQLVDEILNPEVAKVFGLFSGQLVAMIHCGSRGLGHQVCTDYVRTMVSKLGDYDIKLPDRELACAPFSSEDGQNYFKAMKCSANFAWANRHVIGHCVRTVIQKMFGTQINVQTLYDVSHNIGKIEEHTINDTPQTVVVHRKGATRSFGPGNKAIPEKYQSVGQPVLIPGTMGTASYVLVGTQEAEQISFGSTCHGAGRRLSRMAAKKKIGGDELRKQLEAQGIVICCRSNKGLAEEAPFAYKDIANVVDIVDSVGIAKKVVRLKPLAVIKG